MLKLTRQEMELIRDKIKEYNGRGDCWGTGPLEESMFGDIADAPPAILEEHG